MSFYIMFSDIVGFSKQPTNQRLEESISLFNECLSPKTEEVPNLLLFRRFIPTGDGAILIFENDPNKKDSDVAEAFVGYALKLLKKLHDEVCKLGDEKFSVRVGLHYASKLKEQRDVSVQNLCPDCGLKNFIGRELNRAQRIMDIGQDNHILISREMFQEMTGGDIISEYTFSNKIKAKFSIIEDAYKDKHQGDYTHLVNVFELDNPEQPFGNDKIPTPKIFSPILQLSDIMYWFNGKRNFQLIS